MRRRCRRLQSDAQISPKLWPRVTLVWSIAYNTELVKNPPKTWMDLTKPEYDKRRTRYSPSLAAPRGPASCSNAKCSARIFGRKQAATHPVLYPFRCADVGFIGARRSRDGTLALQRGLPEQKDGAPIKIVFPPEGAPVNPYATGIRRPAGAYQCREAISSTGACRRKARPL